MKKNLWIISFITLVIVSACSKVHDDVSPSNNQNVLGMVIQAPANVDAGLILLKDGRAISPQSGFNPARVSAGGKFLLSFEPLSSTGKVLNVHVTSFALAADSTFVPPPINGSDSVAFITAMQGTHNCIFTSASVDYSAPGDTTKVVLKDFDISVDGNMFEASASYAPVPGGNGFFYFDQNNHNLYFVNYAHFPDSAGLPPGFLLSGHYYYAIFENYIALWTYTGNTYSGYTINR